MVWTGTCLVCFPLALDFALCVFGFGMLSNKNTLHKLPYVIHLGFYLCSWLLCANLLLFCVFFLWCFSFLFLLSGFSFFCCFSLFVLESYLIPLFLAYLSHSLIFLFFTLFLCFSFLPIFLACLCDFFFYCSNFVNNTCFSFFFVPFCCRCFWLYDGILAMFLFLVTMCVSSGFELRACGSCVSSFT